MTEATDKLIAFINDNDKFYNFIKSTFFLTQYRIEKLSTIQETFSKLSDPNYNVDFVIIGTDELIKFQKNDMYDILQTLSTLIKCTVYRKNKKINKRQTKIVILISKNADNRFIRELLSIKQIDYFSLDLCFEDNNTVSFDKTQNFLTFSQNRVSKEIINQLNCNKQKPNSQRDLIQLTDRQQQIFDIVTTRGSSNKHIARLLEISESTVKLHMGSIFKKYGVKNRTQLAVFSKTSY